MVVRRLRRLAGQAAAGTCRRCVAPRRPPDERDTGGAGGKRAPAPRRRPSSRRPHRPPSPVAAARHPGRHHSSALRCSSAWCCWARASTPASSGTGSDGGRTPAETATAAPRRRARPPPTGRPVTRPPAEVAVWVLNGGGPTGHGHQRHPGRGQRRLRHGRRRERPAGRAPEHRSTTSRATRPTPPRWRRCSGSRSIGSWPLPEPAAGAQRRPPGRQHRGRARPRLPADRLTHSAPWHRCRADEAIAAPAGRRPAHRRAVRLRRHAVADRRRPGHGASRRRRGRRPGRAGHGATGGWRWCRAGPCRSSSGLLPQVAHHLGAVRAGGGDAGPAARPSLAGIVAGGDRRRGVALARPGPARACSSSRRDCRSRSTTAAIPRSRTTCGGGPSARPPARGWCAGRRRCRSSSIRRSTSTRARRSATWPPAWHAVCYLGDDVGDLAGLRRPRRAGRPGRGHGAGGGRRAREAPGALVDRADVVVEGPTGALDFLRRLL